MTQTIHLHGFSLCYLKLQYNGLKFLSLRLRYKWEDYYIIPMKKNQ